MFQCGLRGIIFPIQIFLFQGSKERLGHSIIVRFSRIGERLYALLFMKKLLKTVRCVLRAAVTVKNESCLWLTQLIRHFVM